MPGISVWLRTSSCSRIEGTTSHGTMAPSIARWLSASGTWGTGIPIPVTPQFMERGGERYNINCAICHGPTGAGDGIVKQYGMATIVSIVDDRITNMSDGEIFNTITHGKNTMMSYGGTVTVNDRWAIIAYLRALQRSQRATAADVPPEARVELEKQ